MRNALPALVLLAGCGQDVPFSLEPWDLEKRSMADDEAEHARLRAEIDALRGTRACQDVSECTVIPFGYLCTIWLPYSTTVTDAATLSERVALYNWLDEFIAYKWGIGSDCGGPPAPTLACKDGVCRNLTEH